MTWLSKRGKRLFAFLIGFLMILNQFGISGPETAYGQTHDHLSEHTHYDEIADVSGLTDVLSAAEDVYDTKGAAIPETPAVRAAADGAKAGELTVLAFSSDVHNSSNNTAAGRMSTWMDNVIAEYGKIDTFGFCGDMGSASAGESEFWTYTKAVMDAVDNHNIQAVYTTGNHEFYNGKYSSTSNSVKSRYILEEEGLNGGNYRIYCLGTDNWNNSSDNYTQAQVNKMATYLGTVENGTPIFVLTHFPLHYCASSGGMWGGGGRQTTNADLVIDALNTAADSGKKIILLWGHNHTVSDSHYDQIYLPGDTIEYKSGSSKQINFYYGAAGCGSDSEYGTGSHYVLGKGLVVTINSEKQLSFTYYNETGLNVTEGGTFTEQPPVAVTGITIDQTEVEVEVGKTKKLTVTIEPADATNKAVTWSSSDTSVATVDANGKVKGVSEGTATITATAADSATRAVISDSVEVNVIPRESGTEQYFIIKIDNYALSSNASSEITTNSSGYEYHGLQAVTYNANEPAPLEILWTLEEVDGEENGYYIRSYSGEYLKGTYVRGSGSGYTGTLGMSRISGSSKAVWMPGRQTAAI